ncbi:MAG TPA: TolC family protein [Bryobacteraceae bacterium]
MRLIFEEILAATAAQNPDLAATQHTIARQALQVDAARKDFKPDFNVQAVWQRTGPTEYRAYYQITFGVKVPLHYGKQRAELAQAQSGIEPRAQRPSGAIPAARGRSPRAVSDC